MSFHIACKTALPFDAALARVRETLATEGFGMLTEIDVSATLKNNVQGNRLKVCDCGRHLRALPTNSGT
ncbi:MAG: hypothetical protein IPM02_20265 [Betaproteobacteria bacterium]|nr:hypothetical protein [Betaproteobacteria bacterium]